MSYQVAVAVLLVLSVASSAAEEKRPLNDFITHFEPLHYDLKEVHSRARRAAASPFPTVAVELRFKAFGHNFNIRLRRDNTIFTTDYKIVNGNGEKIKFDTGKLFDGEVLGHYPSFAHGSIVNGRFEGNIGVRGDEFHVEPSHRYFDNEPDFHSVIYKSRDVKYEVNHADIEKRIPPSMKSEINVKSHNHSSKESAKERYRRGVSNRNKNTCKLKLVADQTFTRRFINKEGALIQMINHYKAVEYVFRNQTFNLTDIGRKYRPQSIGFRVSRIVVYDDYDVPELLKPNYISVEDLLDRFSTFNHGDVCEAFLFTDRTFNGGVVGLAWIGYAWGQAGGICEPFASFAGKQRSYNTGLLTFKLYGKDSPPAVTEITLAHELGHAFGAKHDPKGCQPGGKKGNFIMYDKATTGYLEHNKEFSACSINEMVPVINWKGISTSNGCFKDISESFCGNGVIEWGEECDCGDVTTCTDICCTPAGVNKVVPGSSLTDLGTTPCRLRNIAYQCSPSQGSCCNNQTCRYARQGLLCGDPTDCLPESRCLGDRPDCPAKLPRQNKTLCDDGSGVCISGYCTGSRCLSENLESCACAGTEKECHVCCMHGGTCKPWHEFHTNSKIINQTAGSICLNSEGYCDSLGFCQRIDRDGPLRSLYKTFFTFRGFSDWVKRYWWTFVIGVPIALALMFAFVYYCQYFTPSSNPERELRHPRRTIRGRTRNRPPGRRSDEAGIPMM